MRYQNNYHDLANLKFSPNKNYFIIYAKKISLKFSNVLDMSHWQSYNMCSSFVFCTILSLWREICNSTGGQRMKELVFDLHQGNYLTLRRHFYYLGFILVKVNASWLFYVSTTEVKKWYNFFKFSLKIMKTVLKKIYILSHFWHWCHFLQCRFLEVHFTGKRYQVLICFFAFMRLTIQCPEIFQKIWYLFFFFFYSAITVTVLVTLIPPSNSNGNFSKESVFYRFPFIWCPRFLKKHFL